MIDKNKAKQLREQGLSYQQIAEELSCSLDWCKRNLKDVVKNINEKAIIDKLIVQAKSSNGLTTGEINSIVKAKYKLEHTLTDKEKAQQEFKIMTRLKTKIKSVDKTVVRPYWMKPTESKKALQLVLQAVNLIDDRIFEEVQYIMQELDLDETYVKSLTRIITQMSYGGHLLVPNNIKELCDSLTKSANELETRNKS